MIVRKAITFCSFAISLFSLVAMEEQEPSKGALATPLYTNDDVQCMLECQRLESLHEVNGKNKLGMTRLMYACEEGDLAQVTTLIRAGARIDDFNNNWYTPLMYAAIGNHKEVVIELLGAGAAINQTNIDGQTALTLARLWASKEMEELLKSYGGIEGYRLCLIL